ncbi:hypothetical protein VPHD51_0181 [Vibrio phage D51]
MKQNETFPLWHFVVRGLAHVGWTALAMMAYIILPTPLMGLLMFIALIVGHLRIIDLMDVVLLEKEDE